MNKNPLNREAEEQQPFQKAAAAEGLDDPNSQCGSSSLSKELPDSKDAAQKKLPEGKKGTAAKGTSSSKRTRDRETSAILLEKALSKSDDEAGDAMVQLMYRYKLADLRSCSYARRQSSIKDFVKRAKSEETLLFDAARLSSKEKQLIRDHRDKKAALWLSKVNQGGFIDLDDFVDPKCPRQQRKVSAFEKRLKYLYGDEETDSEEEDK